MKTSDSPWKRLSFGTRSPYDESHTEIDVHKDDLVLVYVESDEDDEYESSTPIATGTSVEELEARMWEDYAETWEEKVPLVKVDSDTRSFDDYANTVCGYDIRRADRSLVCAWVDQSFVELRKEWDED